MAKTDPYCGAFLAEHPYGDQPAEFVLPEDAYAPRTEEQRYRLYQVRDGELRLLTTSTADALGVALVQQDADAREAGYGALYELGMVGVLDAIERRWLVLPWPRGGP